MSWRDRLSDAKAAARDKLGPDTERHRERIPDMDSADVRRRLRAAGEQIDPGDVDPPPAQTQRETLRAAEEASTMAPPVDADLRPTTSPEHVDKWVTSSGGASSDRKPQGSEAETGALGFEIDDFGGGGDSGSVDDLVAFGSGDDRGESDELGSFEFGLSGSDDDGWLEW